MGIPPESVALLQAEQIDLYVATVPKSTFFALGLVVIAALMLFSAFFSSSEIALFSLASHRIETLAETGATGADTLKELRDDPHRLLITILVGNNIVNIAMSSIATGVFALYLTQGQAVAVATFGITAIVLLFGESAPKSYAVENTESWSLRVARPLRWPSTSSTRSSSSSTT